MHDKLNPVFFELAEINRQMELKWEEIQREYKQKLRALGPTAPAKLRNEADLRYDEKCNKLTAELQEKLEEISRRSGQLSYNPLSYCYLAPEPGQSVTDDLVPYLHWMRHRESLRTTSANDAEGDIKAWRKIARTQEDFRRIAHKKGPIKPFQGDVVHRELLELILCFEIKPLTADELAECMDRYCACGKDHDARAVAKQSARLRKELQACLEAKTVPTTPTP